MLKQELLTAEQQEIEETLKKDSVLRHIQNLCQNSIDEVQNQKLSDLIEKIRNLEPADQT